MTQSVAWFRAQTERLKAELQPQHRHLAIRSGDTRLHPRRDGLGPCGSHRSRRECFELVLEELEIGLECFEVILSLFRTDQTTSADKLIVVKA